jgi:hypothetical protein
MDLTLCLTTRVDERFMASHAHSIRITRHRFVFPVWRLNIFWRMRKDLLVGRLLLIAGFIISLLMIAEIIAASLWLCFLALGLIGLGGIILLICCGEIA